MKMRNFVSALVMMLVMVASMAAQVKYTATVASDSATTSEVEVYKVTIPASAWADGEGVLCEFITVSKQNAGSTVNLTTRVECGSGVVVVGSAVPQYNSAVVGRSIRSIYLKRVGGDVYVNCAPNAAQLSLNNAGVSYDALAAPAGGKLTGVDFTSDVDIVITAQWSAANANTYFNVIYGDAVKR